MLLMMVCEVEVLLLSDILLVGKFGEEQGMFFETQKSHFSGHLRSLGVHLSIVSLRAKLPLP